MKKTTKKQAKKTTKPSTKKLTREKKLIDPKRAQWWEEYREMGTWRKKPYSAETLERLASELIKWVRETDRLYIERFYLEMNISSETWTKFLKRSEVLKKAYEQAKQIMAIKREEAAHDRKADRSVLEWRQMFYSPQYKEFMEWKSGLRQQEQKAGASSYTIEMSPVPTSDDVPPKEEE